jgi:glycosyltransferase involved in cell wall biosynthesis
MTSGALLASVVISNYNYGRFLREAIDSALNQTYAPTEVIVVDDGSTDGSRDIIAAYGDRVASVLKATGGMASAQNAGFAACRGDVVVFLDADDTLVPTAFEQAVPPFENRGVVKVHGPIWEVDKQGKRTGRVIPNRILPGGNLRGVVIEGGPDACACAPIHGNIWRRDFLESVLPMPEDVFRRHSDMYLMMLAPLFGEVRTVAEPLGSYRMHGENDYASRPVDERNNRNLEMYDLRCAILAEWLRRMGVQAQPQAWRKGPGYEWMHRLHAATQELKAVVPSGDSVILIDDAQWSSPSGDSAILSARRTIPFLERNGQYWGRPPDDRTAIEELQRLRATGAKWLAVAWPAFWWLEYYKEFHEFVRSGFRCVLENDRVVVFDLRASQ